MSDDEWSTGSNVGETQDIANKAKFDADIERYKICVIGGGSATIKLCHSLLDEYEKLNGERNCKGEIAVISEEEIQPYEHGYWFSTSLLNPELQPPQGDSFEPNGSFYTQHGFVLKNGFRAEKFQPDRDSLTIVKTTDDSISKVLFYENVVFATGMRYKQPTGHLAEIGKFYTINDQLDANRILNLIGGKKDVRVIVVGHSLEAVEAACAFASWTHGTRGHVTIITEEKKLCAPYVSPKDSKFLSGLLQNRSTGNIKVHLGVKITTIYGHELTLSNNERISLDFGVVVGDLELSSDKLFRHHLRLAPFPSLGVKVSKSFRAVGYKNVFVAGSLASQEIDVNTYSRITTDVNLLPSSTVLAANILGGNEEYSIIAHKSKTFPIFTENGWVSVRVDHFGDNKNFRSCKPFGTTEEESLFGSLWIFAGKIVAATVWNSTETNREKICELLGTQYDKSMDIVELIQ